MILDQILSDDGDEQRVHVFLVESNSGIARKNRTYYIPLMKTISLKLPENLLELLEREARARRTTKSSMVRECLEKALVPDTNSQETSCYDLARDLVGSVKGLPKDLATNPKYMDDFGQ